MHQTMHGSTAPPKMVDVAALAGVSTATVSRVLNNLATVNEDLATRVRDAAERLGYRTNGPARSLRRQRADVWALIISDIGDPFFTSVARGVEDVARAAGYSVLLGNADDDPETEARYLDVAEREQVSGVILSPNSSGSDLSRLHNARIPIVVVDRALDEPVDTVVVNSRDGAQAATTHLLDEGYVRPACITGPSGAGTAELRAAGYADALRAAGGAWQPLVRHAAYRADEAYIAAVDLLSRTGAPDAFFVANSTMALGVLQAFAERGLRPGRDVGLVTFDDAPWTRFTDPPLTVVAQPAHQMGVRAAKLLDARRAGTGRPPAPTTEVLTVSLLVRGSSRRNTDHRAR